MIFHGAIKWYSNASRSSSRARTQTYTGRFNLEVEVILCSHTLFVSKEPKSVIESLNKEFQSPCPVPTNGPIVAKVQNVLLSLGSETIPVFERRIGLRVFVSVYGIRVGPWRGLEKVKLMSVMSK